MLVMAVTLMTKMRIADWDETPVEEFEQQFRLNLRPTYLITQAVLPQLIDASGDTPGTAGRWGVLQIARYQAVLGHAELERIADYHRLPAAVLEPTFDQPDRHGEHPGGRQAEHQDPVGGLERAQQPPAGRHHDIAVAEGREVHSRVLVSAPKLLAPL